MKRTMRQRNREITDPAIICAMLDRMEIMYLGMNDGPAPYVVPLNFGYSLDEDLTFYFHCAKAGHKLECLARDPNVCVTAASFISYAQQSVKGHLHDYRSIIARGVARQIDPEKEPEAFLTGMERILVHNHRDPADAATPVMKHLQIWRVACRWEDVSAKAEIPPKTADEVEFAAPLGDDLPIDDSHILDMHRGKEE